MDVMMRNNITYVTKPDKKMNYFDKYQPCFCGSGLKYKFCHHNYNQKNDPMMTNISETRTFEPHLLIPIDEIRILHGFKSEKKTSSFMVGTNRILKYNSKYFSEKVTLQSNGITLKFTPASDGCSLELFKIEVEDSGRGEGSRILSEVVRICDKHNVSITLNVIPYIDVESDNQYDKKFIKLVNWYHRNGFRYIPNSAYMKYTPQSVSVQIAA
jgi:hypothetical protein